jgi:hypothetical protein
MGTVTTTGSIDAAMGSIEAGTMDRIGLLTLCDPLRGGGVEATTGSRR